MSEGFLQAIGAQLAAGRAFTPFDGATSAPVVMINGTFARQFFGGGPATGRVLVSYTTRIGPIGANLFAPPAPPPDRHRIRQRCVLISSALFVTFAMRRSDKTWNQRSISRRDSSRSVSNSSRCVRPIGRRRAQQSVRYRRRRAGFAIEQHGHVG